MGRPSGAPGSGATHGQDGDGDCCVPFDVPRWVHAADLSLLTDREREILVALGDCLPNIGIADRCCVTERTVKKHVTSIFGKLEISSRAEAAVIATCRKQELYPHGVLADTVPSGTDMAPSVE
ncbi:helix-turn-helix transcriptional regulator [Streptomyces sp. LP05-1]|uniref:Helix-turn-helix transcriptional regulator n=1 Tax=Streptomyces pyxinae TaxID=2970734 RepID=A0ABT2CIB3_9ACTN|nr:helix-turn-helix transcriptional regulator [Streptomyces sp. LP05-1]MCS0636451.1 helix-turn-helix transcriptional regulator [Streptomyces sp. LP05-1]